MQFHSSYKCAETSELNSFHGHTYIQHSMFLGKRAIPTNPSKFDEKLFSDIHLCRLHLKQGREIHERDRQTEINSRAQSQTSYDYVIWQRC